MSLLIDLHLHTSRYSACSSIDASKLDAESLVLVRIAALVAVDAPIASYVLNLDAVGELGINPDRVQDVLAAVAPIVGTARVVSAAVKIMQALGITIELAILAAEADANV